MKDIRLARQSGPEIWLDPSSALDLRSVRAGGVDWAPGLAIVDDGDPRIWHSLQGFLFTAGPDHRGHPEPLDSGTGEGRYPLHGSLAGHPPVSINVQDDGSRCTAQVPVRLADGGEAMLHRDWSIDVDGTVYLADRVENTGKSAFPPMLLYHMNINTRLFGPETRFAGRMLAQDGLVWDFDEKPVSVRCVPAQPTAGEDGFATVSMGPVPGAGGLSLDVHFDTRTLPYLQFWRNRAPGIHVFGIEPCSHALEKRPALASAGAMPALKPGESNEYRLRFRFSRD